MASGLRHEDRCPGPRLRVRMYGHKALSECKVAKSTALESLKRALGSGVSQAANPNSIIYVCIYICMYNSRCDCIAIAETRTGQFQSPALSCFSVSLWLDDPYRFLRMQVSGPPCNICKSFGSDVISNPKSKGAPLDDSQTPELHNEITSNTFPNLKKHLT